MTPKPQALKVKSENIPSELKALKHWVNWKYIWKGKKWDKPPLNPNTGGQAMSNKPATWADFETALEQYNYNGYSGVGFVLTPDDPFTGVDFDHCVDTDTGEIDPEIKEHIDLLNSYSEISPSGTGVRVFVRAIKPDVGCKKGDKEIYGTGQYLTLTGHHISGTPQDIRHRQDEVNEFHSEIFGSVESVTQIETEDDFSFEREMLFDSDYLAIIRESKQSKKFFKLYRGSSSGYDTPSEADGAFCFILAFYTKDPRRIDSIYRRSGRMRPKWDSKRGSSTWGQDLIKRAVSKVKSTYDPNFRPTYTPEYKEVLEAFNKNQDGDAELYVKQNRDRYIFDHTENRWYFWRGNYWEKDLLRFSLRDVDLVIEQYENHLESNNAFGERINSLRTIYRKTRVLELASVGPKGLGITGNEWDRQSMLLPCSNGVVNLEYGTLSPGRPDHYLKTYCSTPYDPDAPEPTKFLEFLDDIFSGNENLIAYIKRLFGYSLIGQQIEHNLIIFFGPRGRNGKTTLVETISDILGSFAMSFGSGLLLSQTFSKNPSAPDSAKLAMRGKRLVITSETNEGMQFDVERVKKFTGGDTLEARGMYQTHHVTFEPSHTLILATNRNPTASFDDDAFWGRVHVVPFNRSFVEAPELEHERPRKTNMKKILLSESKEILNWMVQGCIDYQDKGSLGKPNEITSQTKKYRKEQDQIGMFIDDCLQKGGKTYAGVLYDAYKKWAKNNEYSIMTDTSFYKKLKKLIKSKRVGGGVRYETILIK